MKVLAMFENDLWVVQALEVDMATQAGDKHDSLLDVIAGLGHMFDVRDAIIERENVTPAALRAAPEQYWNAWEDGHAFGTFVLGKTRVAQVRLGTSPFAQTR
jgi:hypothetical protein